MMHKTTRRPACWSEAWPVEGRAPGFWDNGKACGTAMNVPLWLIALEHTPACTGCRRALRGLLLAAGDSKARQAEAFALVGVPPFRFDLTKEPS